MSVTGTHSFVSTCRSAGRTALRRRVAVLTAALVLAAGASAAAAQSHPVLQSWIAAWTSAPSPFLPGGQGAWLEPYTDVSVRQVARLDAGGTSVRVRFTNELGREPLRIGAASIARLASGGSVDEPVMPLGFAGAPDVVIPAGATMLSDPVNMRVSRFDDLAITTWFDEATRPTGHRHPVALSPQGNFAGVREWPEETVVRGATVLSGIQVRGAPARRVLVAFGDSITEGAGATPGEHMSWPEQLSRQLAARPLRDEWTVVNAGISGNRLLHDGGSQNGLARFDRDALSVAGVSDVILLEGINDLGVAWSPTGPRDVVTARDLILAYRQLIERAHLRGVLIYGATLLPYAGAVYFSPRGEAERREVNAWIRESGAFDGVIDLDAVMRDPAAPERLRADFEIGDSLHPNDAGYAAMARTVLAFLAEQAKP